MPHTIPVIYRDHQSGSAESGKLTDHTNYLGTHMYFEESLVVDVDVPKHLPAPPISDFDNLPGVVGYCRSGSGKGIHLICRDRRKAALLSLVLDARYSEYKAEHLDHAHNVRQLIWSMNHNELRDVYRTYGLTDEELSSFLTDRGWKPGERLPHSACPFNPTPGEDTNKSVVLYDTHLHCYRCNKSVSYSTLHGKFRPDRMTLAARNRIPVDNAILEFHAEFGGRFQDRTYRDAYWELVAVNNRLGGERCDEISRLADKPAGFYFTRDHIMISTEGFRLAPASATTVYLQKICPATGYYIRTEKGEIKRISDQAKMTAALSGIAIEGWPTVIAKNGLKLTNARVGKPGHHYIYSEKDIVTTHDIAWAMHHVDRTIGGEAPWVHTLTLLLAIGMTEFRIPAPILVHHGVSGGGKTAAVLLAGAISRTLPKIATPQKNTNALSVAGEAITSGNRIVCYDEWLASKYFDSRELVALGGTRFASRILYRAASAEIDNTAVHVFCGVSIPSEILDSLQASRRIVDPGAITERHDYALAKILNWEEMGDEETGEALMIVAKWVRTVLPDNVQEASEYSDFAEFIRRNPNIFPGVQAPCCLADRDDAQDANADRVDAMRELLSRAKKSTLKSKRRGEGYILDPSDTNVAEILVPIAGGDKVHGATKERLSNWLAEDSWKALHPDIEQISAIKYNQAFRLEIKLRGRKGPKFLPEL